MFGALFWVPRASLVSHMATANDIRWGFSGGTSGGLTPGQEDPLEEEMATHSSISAWRIPWTEELGGLQSVG